MMLKVENAKLDAKRKEEETTGALAKAIEGRGEKKRLGEGDVVLDQEKLANAIREERKRKASDHEQWGGEKRRKYGGGMDVDVTEEDMGEFLSLPLDGRELTRLQRGIPYESFSRDGRPHVQLQGRRRPLGPDCYLSCKYTIYISIVVYCRAILSSLMCACRCSKVMSLIHKQCISDTCQFTTSRNTEDTGVNR